MLNATTEEHHPEVLQIWENMEVVMCPRGPASEDESHLDILYCVFLHIKWVIQVHLV